MRSLFTFLGAALVTFLALGWYFNWYTISRPTTADGRTRIEIDVNGNKIKSDLKAGEQRVGEFLNKNAPASK
jgi:hypothetical protein